MKYKLIASDFDGTLTDSNGKITAETVEAIKKYRRAGGIFIVSTGRTLASAQKRLPDLGLKDISFPLVSFQGSLITDSVTNEVLYSVPMDNSFVKELIDFANKKNIYCHFYTVDNVITEKENKYAVIYCKYANIMDRLIYAGDLHKYIDAHNPQILKVTYVDEDEQVKAAAREANEFLKGRNRFVSAAPMLIECVDPLSGKGNALKFLAKKYNIDISGTVAIGDSMNDYTMIKTAGLGIAVSNADEELKKSAKLIAPSNNENAVAHILDLAVRDEL